MYDNMLAVDRLAAVLFECAGGSIWDYTQESEKEIWRMRARKTLITLGIAAAPQDKIQRCCNTDGVLYVYRVPGQSNRVARGTHEDAVIYLSMLGATYKGTVMNEIPDDGRFALRLTDVCFSRDANNALELAGWRAGGPQRSSGG